MVAAAKILAPAANSCPPVARAEGTVPRTRALAPTMHRGSSLAHDDSGRPSMRGEGRHDAASRDVFAPARASPWRRTWMDDTRLRDSPGGRQQPTPRRRRYGSQSAARGGRRPGGRRAAGEVRGAMTVHVATCMPDDDLDGELWRPCGRRPCGGSRSSTPPVTSLDFLSIDDVMRWAVRQRRNHSATEAVRAFDEMCERQAAASPPDARRPNNGRRSALGGTERTHPASSRATLAHGPTWQIVQSSTQIPGRSASNCNRRRELDGRRDGVGNEAAPDVPWRTSSRAKAFTDCLRRW